MSRSTWRAYGLIVMGALCIQGCEAPLPATPPSSESTLDAASAWAEWQTIAARNQAQWDVDRAMTLTAVMAQTSSGLTPMLNAIGDETVSARAKVLIIIGLTPIRESLNSYIAELMALTSVENSSSVRAFGTHLLGLADGPEVIARTSTLLDDEDRAVREAAMGVLVAVHGEVAAERLVAFWDDPETTVAIREQIILGMSPVLVERFVSLFAEAIVDQRLNAATRYKAATVLGQAGGPEHIAVLQQCAEEDSDPYVRERAQGGVAFLKANAGLLPSDVSAASNRLPSSEGLGVGSLSPVRADPSQPLQGGE